MNNLSESIELIFKATMRLTQQVRQRQSLYKYVEIIEGYAGRLSIADDENPFNQFHAGMTTQSLLEELSELVDVALDIEDEELVLEIDETIEIIYAAAFGHIENPTTEEGEEYGS